MLNKTLIGASLLFSAVSFSQVTLPELGDVHITGLRHSGSGCPAGTAEAIVTPSNAGSRNADYFQITYDAFIAQSGASIPRRHRAKNCDLFMSITFPKNFRFKIQSASYSGYAKLDAGLNAEFTTTYGEPLKRGVRTYASIPGPVDKDFDHNETGVLTNGFYSNCSGSMLLKIENRIKLRGNRRLNGEVTRDIQSGILAMNYGVIWERC